MTWALDGRPIRSVLVTRLRYLGDVVMSTVVLQALRTGDPELRIGYLVERNHAEVLVGHPLVDRLHRLAPGRRGKDAAARAGHRADDGGGAGTLAMVRQLRAAGYDLAVDLFFNPRSAWLLWAAGIRARIGGTPGTRRLLYTHTVTGPAQDGRQDRWREAAPGGLGHHLCRLEPLVHLESGRGFREWFLGGGMSGPLVPVLPRRVVSGETGAALAGVGVRPGEPFLVLAPGATWPSKEWPLDHWRDLIRLLSAGRPEALVVLTPPGRRHRWDALARGIPPGRGGVLPALPLPAALQLLGSAAGLVCVDGGLMHAAVALGVPTVALFGPTDPAVWFPYREAGPFRVLATRPGCHPCGRHECGEFICLPDLRPEDAAAALNSLPT